jgi:glycosyltransferase involved in cell wall biosynthesis
LRIAVYHGLPRGGAFHVMAEMVKRLGGAHTVDVYWLCDPGDAALYPALEGCGRLKRYPFVLTGPGTFLPGSLLYPLHLMRLSRTSRLAASEIDAAHYDALLVFASRHTQAPLLLQYVQTPTVYFCTEPLRVAHEPQDHPARHHRLRHRLMLLARRPFLMHLAATEKQLVRRATRVVTHSQYTADQIRNLFGCKALVVRYGVDSTKYRCVEGMVRENMVLSVGAVHWWKGHEEVIRSLARMEPGERPHLKIVGQVGGRSEMDVLVDLAKRLEVSLEILYDKVSDEELVQLYNRAKLLVCLAHREPFGLTPLESMACGTPVVAADEGGFRETVLDGKVGVRVPRQPEAVAQAVSRLLSDEALWESMSTAGREYASTEWTWEGAISDLSSQLRIVAQNRRESRT